MDTRQQFIVPLAGGLSPQKVMSALRDGSINVDSIQVVGYNGLPAMWLTTEQPAEQARKALNEKDIPFTEQVAYAAEFDNKPGILANLYHELQEKGVEIEKVSYFGTATGPTAHLLFSIPSEVDVKLVRDCVNKFMTRTPAKVRA